MPQLSVNGPKCVAEQTRFVLYSFNTFYRKILESKVSTSARYPGFNKEFGIEVIFCLWYVSNEFCINKSFHIKKCGLEEHTEVSISQCPDDTYRISIISDEVKFF